MLAVWPRLNQIVQRRVASMTEAPPCAVCGYGHAMAAWQVDPIGGIHGRCPHCIPGDLGRTPEAPKPAL